MKQFIINFRAAILALLLILPHAANATFIATTGDGLLVIAASTDDIIATYKGNSAAFSNDLYLVDGVSPGVDLFIFNNHANTIGDTFNLGSFAIGVELLFRLHVNDTGEDFFTGPGSRNPGGEVHARVQTSGLPSPEFATGEVLVSFEDLLLGPFDFNDLGFSFTNTTSRTPTGVPEPAGLALILIIGVILLLTVRRTKSQVR